MSKSFKYVSEFQFPSDRGFTGSAGKTMVKGYARGGSADVAQDKAMVKSAVHKHEKSMHKGEPLTKLARGGMATPCESGAMKKAAGGLAKAKGALRNEQAEMARIKSETRSERKDAGQEMSRVRREERYDEQKVKAPARKRYPTNRSEPMIAMAKGGMLPNRGTLGVMNNKNPGETKKHTAPDLPKAKTMMAKGGMTKAQEAKVGKVMDEYKTGDLHSGSKTGPIVKNRRQAVAIAMSEAGKKKK
jgi:hypothetical protein